MDLITREQLPLVAVLILPGVITAKIFDLLVPGERREAGQFSLEALVYGLINFGLWYAVLVDGLLPMRDTRPWVFRLGLAGVLVISPIVLAVLANAILRSRALRRWVRHPVPTAWDFYFSQRSPSWILVRLKSGLIMGGLFGPRSFASSYPNRDLYIEQTWNLDEHGSFTHPVQQSEGVLVSMSDCESLEFFAWTDEPETDDYGEQVDADQ